ncbi:MAG TPA: hypothetical protein VGH72_33790 [Pseudonocardia sp.]
MSSAADKLAQHTSTAKARKDLKDTETPHLKEIDKEFQRRAQLLGRPGAVSKAHQAVKDEIKSRGSKLSLISLDEYSAEADEAWSLANPPVWPWASKLPFGPGHPLWTYWTRGKGAAKWMSSANPWTTLHALLLKYVGPKAAGETTNVMLATPKGRALFKAHHGKKAA